MSSRRSRIAASPSRSRPCLPDLPVAHSADARDIERLLGSYVNDDPLYLQSTGFVLGPDGAVVTAVYSSAAIGRLVPEDVAGLVRYAREHA